MFLFYSKQKADDQEAASTELGHHNWTLAEPYDKISAPPSSNTPRIIRGNEAAVVGSSLVHMDKEMRANGVHSISTQTSMRSNQSIEGLPRNGDLGQRTEVTSSSMFTRSGMRGSYQTQTSRTTNVSESNQSTEGLPRNGDLGRGTEVMSSSKFTRSEMRGSHQKPRMTNVSVSTNGNNENTYQSLEQRNTPAVSAYSYPYRMPAEDYENSGMVMYTAEEKKAWDRKISTASDASKVKELATNYERRDSTVSPPISPTRNEVNNEIRELKETERTAPILKRLSNRQAPGSNTQQKRVSNYREEYFDEGQEGLASYQSHSSWQVKSGTKTIENRVNRIKKSGAVSVFPD